MAFSVGIHVSFNIWWYRWIYLFSFFIFYAIFATQKLTKAIDDIYAIFFCFSCCTSLWCYNFRSSCSPTPLLHHIKHCKWRKNLKPTLISRIWIMLLGTLAGARCERRLNSCFHELKTWRQTSWVLHKPVFGYPSPLRFDKIEAALGSSKWSLYLRAASVFINWLKFQSSSAWTVWILRRLISVTTFSVAAFSTSILNDTRASGAVFLSQSDLTLALSLHLFLLLSLLDSVFFFCRPHHSRESLLNWDQASES